MQKQLAGPRFWQAKGEFRQVAHDDPDLWGRILADEAQGGDVEFAVRREDGALQSDAAAYYLAPWSEWLDCERAIVRAASGAVLDLGCGAGRVALHLQEMGHRVVGVDRSPGALEVARARGLQRAELGDAMGPWPRGSFETATLLGNNAGIAGNCRATVALLTRLRARLGPKGRVLFSTRDPHAPGLARDRFYQNRLVKEGRYEGEYRFRIEYAGLESRWFGLVLFDPQVMEAVAHEAGWRLRMCCACSPQDEGFYAGLLDADD